MADPFRKWAQGDEWQPSASQLNAWTDAARLAQQAQRGQPTNLGTPAPAFTPLRIHNATGERIPALGVISFAAPMVTPTISEERFTALPTLNAIKPAAPLDRFAICQRAMEIDEVADNVAMLLGVVPCRISGTGEKAQAIADDLTHLEAGSTGHPIVWQESGEAERFALVQLGSAASEPAPRIRFTILSASFSVGLGALGCDHVVAVVNHISCGGTGVNVGDEVLVYDPEYCHFNLPIPLLVGLSGQATMMSSANYQPGLEYLLDCVAETQAAGCIWMIDNLCCSEEEIISG